MSEIKTTRTHYDPIKWEGKVTEKGLEATLNEIGWENVLQVIPVCLDYGEYFYTIIFKEEGGIE